MYGFVPAHAAKQRAFEQKFDSLLNPDEMRAWLKRLSSAPNQVGSPHDKENAEWILAKFKQWGWQAHIEQFDVMYATPKRLLVEMTKPTRFTASLHEPPIKGDRTSALGGAMPPFIMYVSNGDVTGQLVYVNYGLPADYKKLEQLGVSVKGKIVITRYGGGWRGLKPRLAYEHGAIGCLIYSDPKDDGYFRAEPYPAGPARPPFGVQRGTAANQPQNYPGDPTTPGYAPVPGAKHIPIADAKPIQKIPVLPMSYADATPLLKALGGPIAPPTWRGALPFTYHVGPGPATVHMVLQADWGLKPIYDVIAMLPGSTEPDEWVIRGNHQDGWVFGATDPLSSTVAMLGEAKALGTLYKSGWRPKRTIVYASWDGEEAGLLGSTSWATEHAAELQKKGVLYLNTDGNQRGFFSAGGSHTLQRLVNQVTADVRDPEAGVSVRQRERAHLRIEAAGKNARQETKEDAVQAGADRDIPLSPLGTGSDFSPFLQHLGIASLNMRFDDDVPDGAGHSRYDSFDYFTRFMDPHFAYEVALAEVAGRIVTRTADADLLPLRAADLGEALQRYDADLHREVKDARVRADKQHRLLASKAYLLGTSRFSGIVAAPARLPEVPDTVDLTPLDAVAAKLEKNAGAFDEAYARRISALHQLSASEINQINALLGQLEQGLLSHQGLPGRTWYKNVMQAPGIYSGYGAETIPAVHEPLDVGDWSSAERGAVWTQEVLDGYCKRLDKLTRLLRGSANPD